MNETITEKMTRELPMFLDALSQTDGFTPETKAFIEQDSQRFVADVLELHGKIVAVQNLPEPTRSKATLLLKKELGRQWDFLLLKPDSPDDRRWPTLVCSEEELAIKRFVRGVMQ